METQLTHKTVDFYGDQLVALSQDGVIYTPVKPICDILGIDWEGQRQRIQRDEVLSSSICILQVPTPGGMQSATCLPAYMLHGWMFGISINQIAEHNREHLIRYKKECYRVLHQAFTRTSSLDALEHIPDAQLLAYAELRQREAQVRLTLERIDVEKQALLRGELPLPGHRRAYRTEAGWKQVVQEWWNQHGEHPVKAGVFAQLIEDLEDCEIVLDGDTPRARGISAGRQLKARIGTVYQLEHNTVSIDKEKDKKGNPVYKLIKIDTTPGGNSGTNGDNGNSASGSHSRHSQIVADVFCLEIFRGTIARTTETMN